MEENMKVIKLNMILTGEFKKDKKHGVGVYEWADGRRYNGEWYLINNDLYRADGKQDG